MEFLKKLLSPLTELGIILSGLMTIYIKGRQDEKKAAQQAYAEKNLKDTLVRNKIEDNINGLDDDELERLRKKFNRD